LRPEWVQQFHLAGHSVYDHISIDTHDHPVPEAVWTFYEQASQRFANAAVLIEWDDKIPPLARMLEELMTARERYQRGAGVGLGFETGRGRTVSHGFDWREQQEQLFLHIVTPVAPAADPEAYRTSPVAALHGLKVYRDGYFLRARDTLKDCFPSLAYILGPQLFERLVQDYLLQVQPTHYSINYLGQELPRFLEAQPLDYEFGTEQSAIAELASLDWAEYELKIRANDLTSSLTAADLSSWSGDEWSERRLILRRECTFLAHQWRLFGAWLEIRDEQTPPPPEAAREWIVFELIGGHVRGEVVTEAVFAWYQKLRVGARLSDLLEEAPEPVELTVKDVLVFLLQLAEKGLLRTLDSCERTG
jgi:hypothetical protein